MEYLVAKQLGVANKIFGLAHARFPDEVDFVARYLTFLMPVNDEIIACTWFENAAETFDPDKALALRECWARHEYQNGNLEAALKLEKRMAEAFPKDPPIKQFAQKHSYANIDGIANSDPGVCQFRDSESGILMADTNVPIVSSGAPINILSIKQLTKLSCQIVTDRARRYAGHAVVRCKELGMRMLQKRMIQRTDTSETGIQCTWSTNSCDCARYTRSKRDAEGERWRKDDWQG
ncbi:hypothetical protein DFH11DRAFT_1234373 [Phellopilus nigrolimitatus]|nr:hypothetical protein DFH11DRAFT_1234373 [Phellopilus nigrolimitatus]